MAELPPAPWTQHADLLELVAALAEGTPRYVGGAVRDTLLGLKVNDIDLAITLPPAEVIARLDAAGIRSAPTGIAHGTVTAILASGIVEITTLRRDVSTDGRRATVEYADDFREDAARRDFTINALYADPLTLEVFDWFGGLDDLKARRVSFIGDPRQRIREDHLRILRYFRFQARFGSQPADEEAESACTELAPTLKGLSRERVGWELQNLLALPDPAPTVARMIELGVLPVILPESGADQLEALSALVATEAREKVAPDPVRRLAALLPAAPALAEAVGARFRLSNAQRKRLVVAARRDEPDNPSPRTIAYRLGMEGAVDRLLLAGASVGPLAGWEIPRLPLKGGQIVARGVEAGPEVARILHAVEARWVEEGFPDAARVEAILTQLLN